MSQFKDMKFRIANPEQSKRLQEVLFKLGYFWFRGEGFAMYTDQNYLYVSDSGYITYDNNFEFFSSDEKEAQNTEQFIVQNSGRPELVKHKWYDVIVAAAEGKTVQKKTNDHWRDYKGEEAISCLGFASSNEYRIKPDTVDVWQWAFRLVGGNAAHISSKFYADEEEFKKANQGHGFDYIVKIEPTKKTVEK